jgi:hypothetical protein
MKNFIEVLDDGSMEDRIEKSWHKNKKYFLPFLALVVFSVYSIDKYDKIGMSNNVIQHETAEKIIVSQKYDGIVVSGLNDFYKLRVLNSFLQKNSVSEAMLADAMTVNPADDVLMDVATDVKMGFLMGLNKFEEALILITNYTDKTAIHWMQLGDLELMKFNFENSLAAYKMASSQAKTHEFKNALLLKIQHASISMQSGGK